ncbi:MAG TPA: glycosyltransferase [Myxococcaceae bacterium]|nr:glycosyltransferase [Myxococcaceae bacterium]
MTVVGSVLIDLEGRPPGPARSYLEDLQRQLRPERIDVRWRGGELRDLPPGVRLLRHPSGADSVTSAGRRASERGHLLVLLAPLLPDPSVLGALSSAFELDPMVGFVQPRFGDALGEGVWQLAAGNGPSPELLARQGLSLLPAHYLTTERLAACILVRRELAAVFSEATDRPEDFRTALLLELVHARRRGFRNLILNRVVIPTAEPGGSLYPSLDPSSRRRLHSLCPDAGTAEEWFQSEPFHRRERVVSVARRQRPASRLPVLIDCRGASPHHNGTSQAMLEIIAGLEADGPRWDIDLLFGSEAARYHAVSSRFPSLNLLTTSSTAVYAAAVCLNQPWHLSTVADLHARAAAISFNMLDTIAWDIVYQCNPEVEKAWSFIAQHADGLLYISEFTRDRYRFRFPVSPAVAEEVIHLGLEPSEYRNPATTNLPGAGHILVFGNHYEHKAVAPTVDLLGRAFPFQPIRAMGARSESYRNIAVLESGHLPEVEVDRLIATARVVVFPSYYEGFGLPVMKALAYGRPVVVRSSPLWHELAALTRAPGRLVEFTLPQDLVLAVGRLLAETEVGALPFGGRLGDAPAPRWRDCARRLVALVERTVERTEWRRWSERERALRLVHG